ncbi:uncharacterized protein LOC106143399 [Amyelois transitella]|uniref:uncharacterized protein LOC106143399 n=1 Tax=Amyelois transitella TaxID=680683 RepID=UPI00298FA050|nr:uncharacterized protein LOC106143399 [Amyelois transitella]
MADSAAARREARRKRILDNSSNRLQLIAGKASTESSKSSPIRCHNPEQPLEVPLVAIASENSSISKASLNNGVLVNESEPLELLSNLTLSHRQDTVAAGDTEIVSDVTSFSGLSAPSTTSVQNQTIWEKITVYKYDLVLLSLLVQVLYSFSLMPIDNNYIFLPFAMYAITKQIYFPVQSSSKLANVLLLLNGLSGQANAIQKALNISQWIGAIFQDIFIYLFTTICVQSLYVLLKDCFIT